MSRYAKWPPTPLSELLGLDTSQEDGAHVLPIVCAYCRLAPTTSIAELNKSASGNRRAMRQCLFECLYVFALHRN